MEQGALESQASTTLNRDADLEERLSQLVYDNESLKIEVGRLQGILERSGALKAHELQSENETQRHTIEHLTTQLTEKEQQLGELRSANTRFANIDATVQNFLTQLQAQQDEVTQLKRTLEEKESELQAVRANANAANESHKSAAALEETNAKLQRDLSVAQRNARDVTQQLNEAMTRQQEDSLAAQKVREQLASLQVAHNVLHAQLQAKQAELDKALQEVQMNKMQRVSTPAGDTRGLHNDEEEEIFDEAALTPRMKAYVQRCIAQATAGVEQRLREQTDLNASLLAFKAMVQNEKEINASRENEASGKTVTAAPAPVNAECVQLRNKQQEAYQEMQRRVSQVLAADKLSKRDIQLLLQEMLDYQEKADEDMRTRLLIKDIQFEELNKLQEEKIKRLETENGSLLKQLHDAMQARNEAQPSRTATPRQQQQQQRPGHTTVVVPVLPDRQRSISPGTQTCSMTSSPARGMSGSESTSAGVTPLYARQPSIPTTLYSNNNYNNSNSNSVSGAGGTMSPRWAAVMSGPAMGVPVLSSGRQGNGQCANGVGEQQQRRSNAAATTMPAAAATPLSSGHYYHNPNLGMQAASSQSTMMTSAHGTSEMAAAAGRGMIMCPACAYWQLNDNQTCCCCGRILPRH